MKILHQQLVINCDCVIVVLRQVYLKTFQIDYCKNYLSEQWTFEEKKFSISPQLISVSHFKCNQQLSFCFSRFAGIKFCLFVSKLVGTGWKLFIMNSSYQQVSQDPDERYMLWIMISRHQSWLCKTGYKENHFQAYPLDNLLLWCSSLKATLASLQKIHLSRTVYSTSVTWISSECFRVILFSSEGQHIQALGNR